MSLVGLEDLYNLCACMLVILSSVGFYFKYTRFLWYMECLIFSPFSLLMKIQRMPVYFQPLWLS